MKDFRFGIEIETVGASYERLARAIEQAIGGRAESSGGWRVVDRQGRAWKLVHDGSLESSSYHSAEVVSPILTYDDLETLQAVVRALKAAGASTNSSCGIHVHVDAASLGVKGLVNLAKLVHQQEELIVEALGIQQRRLARYTRKLPTTFVAKLDHRRPRTMDDLNTAWYGSRREGIREKYDQSRYHGLNLHSVYFRGTVEFRWFEGTLNPGKVKAYIQFCLALADKARKNKSAVSRKRAFARATSRYDFRVFLLRLGLIGSEFKTARKHLLEKLGGSSAWKHTGPATSGSSNPAPDTTPRSAAAA